MSLRGCNSHPLTFMGGFILAKGFTALFMRDASVRPVRGNHPGCAEGKRAKPAGAWPSPAGLPGARNGPAGATSPQPHVRADFLALGALGAVSFPPSSTSNPPVGPEGAPPRGTPSPSISVHLLSITWPSPPPTQPGLSPGVSCDLPSITHTGDEVILWSSGSQPS